jgi:hypothetical protein
MRRSRIRWLLILAAALPTAARAETSVKDLAVVTRALGFLEPRLAGAISVAIVYADGDEASIADARQIRMGFASSAIKGVGFQPRLVAASDTAALAGARVIFLATGAGHQAAIAAAAVKAHAVTVSSNMACVNARSASVPNRLSKLSSVELPATQRRSNSPRHS